MSHCTAVARGGKFAAIAVFFATAAAAQTPVSASPPAPSPPSAPWTVAAGVESLWWRDVARTGPPVDGSPVSWEGQGPIVYVSHDRGSRARWHHFEGSVTAAGGFELRSPVRATAAPGDDGASRISGRYEYRRYPWRDLWTAGFDVGAGVEASGERLSFDRNFEPDIELHRRFNNLGTAFVLAARWQQSARWSLLAAWGNGLTIGRSSSDHQSGAETKANSQWGGGWQTNFELRGDIRVAPKARLTAAWFTSGEGHFESHGAATFGRSRFTMGVSYGQ